MTPYSSTMCPIAWMLSSPVSFSIPFNLFYAMCAKCLFHWETTQVQNRGGLASNTLFFILFMNFTSMIHL
ncbi:hypothetical protein XELAEV_18013863mg [Xenopus laevis]|uniref:Uncharacterized protein n=1 Tax=Xenopus laevis TaxID=8355 RepID=A0A974DQC3_XENLA|nr:hypothetical protein XELAEV_18013863mg [Xenopus laevis]